MLRWIPGVGRSKRVLDAPNRGPVSCAKRLHGDLDRRLLLGEKCQCNLGFEVTAASTCRPKRVGSSSCLSDEECSAVVKFSTCVAGQCACETGRASDADGSRCILRALGDECFLDEDCSAAGENSVCEQSVCTCKPGYRLDNDSYAHDIVQTDANVVVDLQESTNGFAGEDTMTDVLESKPNRPKCVLRQLGERCLTDIDCSATKHATCTDGHCTCSQGFYLTASDNATCEQRVLKSPCLADEDCSDAVDNSRCVERHAVLQARFGQRMHGRRGVSVCNALHSMRQRQVRLSSWLRGRRERLVLAASSW